MAEPARPPLRPRTLLYTTTVIVVGFAAVAVSVADVIRQSHGNWLVLAALTLVSGWLSVKLPSTSASISISETFVFAGTLLFGRSVGTVLVLLDDIVLSVKSFVSGRRPRPAQILFNLAMPPLSSWLAATAAGIVNPLSATAGIDYHFVLVLAAFT